MPHEREDRRNRKRFEYPAVVTVNGLPARGRDINAIGLSATITLPKIGDVVQVTLSHPTDEAIGISSRARVVRVESSGDGYVFGLEFMEEPPPQDTTDTEPGADSTL
jgi:hypothetical protein